MPYEIAFSQQARRQMRRLGRIPAYPRIEAAIDALAIEPRPVGSLKLSIRSGYRIRIGAYRVIYEIDDEVRIVSVTRVGHRSSVYLD